MGTRIRFRRIQPSSSTFYRATRNLYYVFVCVRVHVTSRIAIKTARHVIMKTTPHDKEVTNFLKQIKGFGKIPTERNLHVV